jgi:hypothetical protein
MSDTERRLIIHLWRADWDVYRIAATLGYPPSRIEAVVRQYAERRPAS